MAKRGNGEGSIYKRKDGKWMGSLTIGRDSSGKIIRKTIYGKTRQEVLIKMDTIKHDIKTSNYVEPDKITVEEWLLYWLKSYKKNKLKPRTYDSYESLSNINIIPYIGQIKLQKLKTKDIQDTYNKRYEEGLSASTISKINIVLKSALKKAITENYIVKNPADFVELPNIEKKDIKAFTLEEQNIFEKVAKDYSLFPAFIVNLDTGLRKSEILALTWNDIDFDKGEISVNKNLVVVKDRDREKGIKTLIQQNNGKTKNSVRIIPLTKRCINILKQLKVKQQSLSNIVFCSKVGTHVSPRNYSRAFQKVLKKANIDMCNVHTMRHTFATRLFEAGAAAKQYHNYLVIQVYHLH
ncbi:tyrosine-type recombinase/integrase [Pseudobacteroides cellulosolvens]|uniref:Integrase family protein n=1 Tax=Pseudobacteroides cellulosolvens ATCC 35603 = DSM 2933 TaxID=398512 RepID=A0A0L6JHQ5_9FIRM|nr:site-specific integrase [Pseudobacteroides cellulosolvens]KNY25022.1 integrase family protein [Pseudobacteroides cellulosolvens ATCC 35603 = DSM 2933]